jgi:hypothetical protein
MSRAYNTMPAPAAGTAWQIEREGGSTPAGGWRPGVRSPAARRRGRRAGGASAPLSAVETAGRGRVPAWQRMTPLRVYYWPSLFWFRLPTRSVGLQCQRCCDGGASPQHRPQHSAWCQLSVWCVMRRAHLQKSTRTLALLDGVVGREKGGEGGSLRGRKGRVRS